MLVFPRAETEDCPKVMLLIHLRSSGAARRKSMQERRGGSEPLSDRRRRTVPGQLVAGGRDGPRSRSMEFALRGARIVGRIDKVSCRGHWRRAPERAANDAIPDHTHSNPATSRWIGHGGCPGAAVLLEGEKPTAISRGRGRPRRHCLGGQLHRHGAAGVAGANRHVRLRSHCRTARRLQRPREERRPSCPDRSADLQGAVARDEANLATANAEVARATALRQQAINDERRAEELRAMNEDYLADSVMDQYKFQRLSLEAQLEVAHAAVKQATATSAELAGEPRLHEDHVRRSTGS